MAAVYRVGFWIGGQYFHPAGQTVRLEKPEGVSCVLEVQPFRAAPFRLATGSEASGAGNWRYEGPGDTGETAVLHTTRAATWGLTPKPGIHRFWFEPAGTLLGLEDGEWSRSIRVEVAGEASIPPDEPSDRVLTLLEAIADHLGIVR